MAKAGITLKLNGFEDVLKDIEAAGKKAEDAIESVMKESAYTVDAELRKQLRQATESDLASRMPKPKVEKGRNRVTAYVGFEMGEYKQNDLSDGFKALFINYGTPHRKKHGIQKGKFFITTAKQNAKKTIKKKQKGAFEKIIARLKIQ